MTSQLIQGYMKTRHPLYQTHKGMKARCYYVKSKYYQYYGGRGITVCARWLGPEGFGNFVKDMGTRPDKYTLERINNNKSYSPKNCKWESMENQSLNKRLKKDNTSGYPGVHLFKATGKWSVYIDFRRKRHHLGYYDTYKEAVEARIRAEKNRTEQLIT